MTENMKKFLELVSQSEELCARVNAADKEALIAMAKELGVELTEEDFTQPSGELDDDELDAVAGGGVCACVVGGGGTADNAKERTCVCVFTGAGETKNGYRCMCALGGGGESVE